MPVRIQNDLPAKERLERENIFVMNESRATTQDIRPLELCILNLMPGKEETELQILRALSNTPLQVNITLLTTASHTSSHTSSAHLNKFYQTWDEVKENRFDGMIITGAPVENLDFCDVDYWDELCEIMEWTKSHVHATLHICWGAQAGLYYHYGIEKYTLPEKLFGVFSHRVDRIHSPWFRGFDDTFYVPHSRYTSVRKSDILADSRLQLISTSEEAGVFALKSRDNRRFFIMGHPEYDPETLALEYKRDVDSGKPIAIPAHYFPNDDPSRDPIVNWRSSGQLLYSNWLNYYVYQSTPYDLSEIQPSI